MRYTLDIDGYISAVAFGCYLDNCNEYTGTVPIGYNTLGDWATYSCIQAYYIDSNGNLALDIERLAERRRKEGQERIDNAPVLRKDLYWSDSVLGGQYVKAVKTGEVIVLEDIMRITPKVKITNVNPAEYTSLQIYTQGRNMLPCSAISKTVGDVAFTRNTNGSITVSGTATEDIEYRIAGSGTTTTPLFAIKGGHDYYLNLGGLQCEMRCFDGETAVQQYVGASGPLNLNASIEVTEVLLKIARGTTVNATFFPQLEYGNAFTFYAEHQRNSMNIDLNEVDSGIIDYILIEDGTTSAYIGDEQQILGGGNVGLYSDYDTLYALQDVVLEVEYSTTEQVLKTALKSVEVYYALGDSPTTAPTGGWSTVAPEWVNGKYMWQKTVTTLGSGAVTSSAPTCISGATGQRGEKGETGEKGATGDKGDKGDKGERGEVGIGIVQIIDYYLASDDTTAPSTGWSTTVQSTSTSNKYLWNYQDINYSDGSTVSTAKRIIGTHGETGETGSTGATGVGISTVTPLYFAKANTTAPSVPTVTVTVNSSTRYNAWNKAMPTFNATYPYYFTCSEILYTNNTRKWTTPVYAGALTSANQTAYQTDQTILAWCMENDRTYIDGSKIYAGSITADQIDVTNLFSNDIEATGSIIANSDSNTTGKFVVNGPTGYHTDISAGGVKSYGFDGQLSVSIDSSHGQLNIFNASGGVKSYFGTGGVCIDGNDLTDFVVAQGTSGIWAYRKWYSGKAECWGRSTVSVTTSSWGAWGNVYIAPATATVSYPFTFASTPAEIVTPHDLHSSYAMNTGVTSYNSNSKSASGQYQFLRGSVPSIDYSVALNFYVVGSWK